MNNARYASGLTLLEVMIALLIFSIGLLGLAGLQAVGIKNNQISYSRTVASQLAYDLADRIRNNPDIDYSSTAASSSTNCITSTCTAGQMAAFDLFEWDALLTNPNSNLPRAQGFVERNGTTYTISIGWDENATGSVPADCTPPTPDTITCISIVVEP